MISVDFNIFQNQHLEDNMVKLSLEPNGPFCLQHSITENQISPVASIRHENMTA